MVSITRETHIVVSLPKLHSKSPDTVDLLLTGTGPERAACKQWIQCQGLLQ